MKDVIESARESSVGCDPLPSREHSADRTDFGSADRGLMGGPAEGAKPPAPASPLLLSAEGRGARGQGFETS